MTNLISNYIVGLVKDYIFVIDNLSKDFISILSNRTYTTQSQISPKEKHSGLEKKLGGLQ